MANFSLKKSLLISIVPLLIFTSACANQRDKTEKPSSYSTEGFSLSLVEDYSGIAPKQVYTFTCELIEQMPSISSPNCADFGEAVFDIKWETWNADGAIGTGTYSLNNCEPNCADGKRLESPAKVRLSGLKTDGSRYFLTEFSYVAEKMVMTGRPKSGGWDTSEFYVNVPDMRSDG